MNGKDFPLPELLERIENLPKDKDQSVKLDTLRNLQSRFLRDMVDLCKIMDSKCTSV